MVVLLDFGPSVIQNLAESNSLNSKILNSSLDKQHKFLNPSLSVTEYCSAKY